ncbi:MAG: hypothetical protein ABEI80_08030 [Haloplanus sp.]
MADLRTLLAAVLGLLIGVVCLLAPGAVARTQALGRTPGQRGEYGTDATRSRRVRRLIRVLGAGCVLAGLYFGYLVLG